MAKIYYYENGHYAYLMPIPLTPFPLGRGRRYKRGLRPLYFYSPLVILEEFPFVKGGGEKIK